MALLGVHRHKDKRYHCVIQVHVDQLYCGIKTYDRSAYERGERRDLLNIHCCFGLAYYQKPDRTIVSKVSGAPLLKLLC